MIQKISFLLFIFFTGYIKLYSHNTNTIGAFSYVKNGDSRSLFSKLRNINIVVLKIGFYSDSFGSTQAYYSSNNRILPYDQGINAETKNGWHQHEIKAILPVNRIRPNAFSPSEVLLTNEPLA